MVISYSNSRKLIQGQNLTKNPKGVSGLEMAAQDFFFALGEMMTFLWNYSKIMYDILQMFSTTMGHLAETDIKLDQKLPLFTQEEYQINAITHLDLI